VTDSWFYLRLVCNILLFVIVGIVHIIVGLLYLQQPHAQVHFKIFTRGKNTNHNV